MPSGFALRRAGRRVHAAFLRGGGTLALAESCTGGLIAKTITDLPGSSRYFWGGAVVYSNEAKSLFALADPGVIAAHGAVSREVAEALALGILRRSGTTLSCAVTGIAGPGGAVPGKPVGTVHVAVAFRGRIASSKRYLFRGGRSRVRRATALAALEEISRALSAASA